MKILHLFSGYNTFTTQAHLRGYEVISIDMKNYKNSPPSTIICDFMNFAYMNFEPDNFDFVLVGFPCTTTSKASGGHHFKNNLALTTAAYKTILMIDRLRLVLSYYNCHWMIENPTSALFANYYFQSVFQITRLNLIRLHQFSYGHKTYKQTDLLTSKDELWLTNTVYRVNGVNFCPNFDNLSLREKQSYPPAFCDAILDYIEL